MKILLTGLAAIVVAGCSDAAVLRFTFSGAADYTFRLDSNPVPDRRVNGAEADFYDVAGDFGGRARADVQLYTSSFGGGIALNDFDGAGIFLNATGPQLFSGTVAAPVLLTGDFDLIGSFGQTYRLNVASVPEPLTWATLAVGFAAMGALTRGRRRATGVRT